MEENELLYKRNRELSIINAIAEALNREVDLTRALNTAMVKVTELFHLHTAWVWLQREDTGATYLAAALNLPPALTPNRMEGTCYCLDVYRLGELEGASNVSIITCTRLKNEVSGTDGLRYHASVPLYHHDRKVGLLNVVSTDWRQLSEDELRLLNTVGGIISIAIERAQLFAHSIQLGAVEERNRLAREIHDTLAQSLAGITLQLETADALMETQPDTARQAMRKALSLSRASLEDARRSVLDLRAAPLERRSLAEALEKLVQQYAKEWKLKARFEAVGGDRPLPIRVEAALYRIAQEALTNIARHAEADHLIVRYVATPDHVDLRIEDDGKGFDPDAIAKDRFGLVGMNERTRLLGGKLDICSEPGGGTRLDIHIPLEMPS
ncbi:MAG TPA: GAF domain-containing sensor histidine kinase [Oceanobacillus sp.]|nr:GAF domain-containing sensor histidine kinase [Oceanobacillus sp.]